MSAVNRGWTWVEYRDDVLSGRLGDKAREKRNPERWLKSYIWDRATKRVKERPAGFRSVTVQHEINTIEEKIARAAALGVFSGRAGCSDLAVLNAHILIMKRTGRIEHGASEREIAEMAGISRTTVRASHRRLRASQWLRCVELSRSPVASKWRVTTPKAVAQLSQSSPYRGGARKDWGSNATGFDPAHDLWRYKALGKNAGRIWSILSTTPLQPAGIAETLGFHRSTAGRNLERLAEHGLALQTDEGWVRGSASIDRVAAELGAAGAAKRQRLDYIRDRKGYRAFLASRGLPEDPPQPETSRRIGGNQ